MAATPPNTLGAESALVSVLLYHLINNGIVLDAKIAATEDAVDKAPTLHLVLDTGSSDTVLGKESLFTAKIVLPDAAVQLPNLTVRGAGGSGNAGSIRAVNGVISLGGFIGDDSFAVVSLRPDHRRFGVDGTIGNDIISHRY